MILGLTGSIAMGKSTVARMFAALGAKVIAADAVVHALLAERGAAVSMVADIFPATYENGAIDRAKLGAEVFADAEKLAHLEAILHPLVAQAEERFAAREAAKGARVIVMDIPLLFETGADARCDFTVTASAPAFLQRARALLRPGMTEEKLALILARQLPDREKRLLADYVVETGLGRAHSFRQVKRILYEMN